MTLLPEIAQSLYDAWWAENGDSITAERVASILKYGRDTTLDNQERYRTWCWIKNYLLCNEEFDLQKMTDDFIIGLYSDRLSSKPSELLKAYGTPTPNSPISL